MLTRNNCKIFILTVKIYNYFSLLDVKAYQTKSYCLIFYKKSYDLNFYSNGSKKLSCIKQQNIHYKTKVLCVILK